MATDFHALVETFDGVRWVTTNTFFCGDDFGDQGQRRDGIAPFPIAMNIKQPRWTELIAASERPPHNPRYIPKDRSDTARLLMTVDECSAPGWLSLQEASEIFLASETPAIRDQIKDPAFTYFSVRQDQVPKSRLLFWFSNSHWTREIDARRKAQSNADKPPEASSADQTEVPVSTRPTLRRIKRKRSAFEGLSKPDMVQLQQEVWDLARDRIRAEAALDKWPADRELAYDLRFMHNGHGQLILALKPTDLYLNELLYGFRCAHGQLFGGWTDLDAVDRYISEGIGNAEAGTGTDADRLGLRMSLSLARGRSESIPAADPRANLHFVERGKERSRCSQSLIDADLRMDQVLGAALVSEDQHSFKEFLFETHDRWGYFRFSEDLL
ncbi:MAG: hypothetical protein AB3N13_03820 [Arenibacterium sp.]